MGVIERYGTAAVGSLILHGLVVSVVLAFQTPSRQPESTFAEAALVVDLEHFSKFNEAARTADSASQADTRPAPDFSPSVIPTQKPEAPQQQRRSVPIATPQPRSPVSLDEPAEQLASGGISTSRDNRESFEKVASGLPRAASGIQQARYSLGSSQNPLPPYPWSARRRGREGRVVIRLSVNAAGQPINAVILVSSGVTSLDQAALKTLRRWHLEPALRLGLPVASEIDVPIRFTLQ